MRLLKWTSFKLMGLEVLTLGVIVFSSLGLGVGRAIINRYSSEISVQMGSLSVNLEYTIIGAALIIVGYEILSFSRNHRVTLK